MLLSLDIGKVIVELILASIEFPTCVNDGWLQEFRSIEMIDNLGMCLTPYTFSLFTTAASLMFPSGTKRPSNPISRALMATGRAPRMYTFYNKATNCHNCTNICVEII